MTPDVMARAFDPFFTTKPKGEGSGLGLATVYGIVAESGGNLHLYSEVGLGTTVRVSFPATTPDASRMRPSERIDVPAGGGETILVVEDEAAMREVTCRMLRRNGYIVLDATNGEDALRVASGSDFDLLLTDVVMPQMSGRELALRLSASKSGIAVLFMSGYSGGVLGPQRVLDDGVALIQKPFNEQALLAKVHEVLDTQSSRGARHGLPFPP
jgi:CheY-like chemotaxis protein